MAYKNRKLLFLYSGEGTHGSEINFNLLKHSPLWLQIEDILKLKLDLELEQVWKEHINQHRCPHSPLLTVVSQICLSDIWCSWGYPPDIVIGHSTGELSAAYQAGLYSLEDILLLAYRIGEVASRLEGVMLHGWLSDSNIKQLSINISSFNFKGKAGTHVTVSGYIDEMDDFIENHRDFVKMKLPHPWHHSDYDRFSKQLETIRSHHVNDSMFVSGLTTRFETDLPDDHWRQWLSNPIDFIRSMQTIKDRYPDDAFDIIEIGFHPVLANSCEIFADSRIVSSMFRGENDIKWILSQRKKLNQEVVLKNLQKIVHGFKPGLDFDTSLAYQGITSLEITRLTSLMQPLFPSLAPQDFFRYKTINRLMNGFGIDKAVELPVLNRFEKNKVVIAGMSCRFPSSVETLTGFWQMLISRADQVRPDVKRSSSEAGFLDEAITRFDHQYFNISQAEARTMDPQQILALELTEMLWKDAGIDPHNLNKKRVGVYIGAWNQEYQGNRNSVYYPTGVNPSIIAARISYHYDLRGPSWVANTACSSSLLAVHYAAKDIEAGRVDYAIAGGVNMLLDEAFTITMQNSGFLSKDNRCKSFDDSANGYVRAEGGGLVLLVNQSLASEYYASLMGSAINQNGGRSQVITAPHPEAQEELILDACHEAQIAPQEIAYVETHGTGTKIGDPIEISAIQNTIAKDRTDTCYVGSVKSNLGHLESAAGIAGLIKSITILNFGLIPPNLHFQHPNQFIDFDAYHIKVVTEETEIGHQAYIGISSFGFGGSNAHIIIKGADESVRKKILPLQIPFDRINSAGLAVSSHVKSTTGQITSDKTDSGNHNLDIPGFINALLFELTGVKEIDPDIELLEQGLDSLSATELISQLEEKLNIEIEPEILFEYALQDQFVQRVCELVSISQK